MRPKAGKEQIKEIGAKEVSVQVSDHEFLNRAALYKFKIKIPL